MFVVALSLSHVCVVFQGLVQGRGVGGGSGKRHVRFAARSCVVLRVWCAGFGFARAEAASICAMLTLKSPWLQDAPEYLKACQESFAVHEGDLVSLLNLVRQYESNREEDREWAKRH